MEKSIIGMRFNGKVVPENQRESVALTLTGTFTVLDKLQMPDMVGNLHPYYLIHAVADNKVYRIACNELVGTTVAP